MTRRRLRCCFCCLPRGTGEYGEQHRDLRGWGYLRLLYWWYPTPKIGTITRDVRAERGSLPKTGSITAASGLMEFGDSTKEDQSIATPDCLGFKFGKKCSKNIPSTEVCNKKIQDYGKKFLKKIIVKVVIVDWTRSFIKLDCRANIDLEFNVASQHPMADSICLPGFQERSLAAATAFRRAIYCPKSTPLYAAARDVIAHAHRM